MAAELNEACEALTALRKKAASPLAASIKKALLDLNFNDVRFEIAFSEAASCRADGRDNVCFMISTNPGMDLRPLQETASGGELSRIMLAIKSVLADEEQVETLIFDEIDAGISGRTAQKVSERLSQIAEKRQVIAITHLPQIAAMADSHYLIEKTSDRTLDHQPDLPAFRRRIGGRAGKNARRCRNYQTSTVLDNAREMKNFAARLKHAAS